MLASGLQCGADGFGAGGRDIAGGQGSARGDRQGEAYPRRGAETGEGHLRAHVRLSRHAPPRWDKCSYRGHALPEKVTYARMFC